MDLRTSLLGREKPEHQFHDSVSLQWIDSHRPKELLDEYEIDSQVIPFISDFKPWKQCRDSWFLDHLIRDGIHGFRHVCRVAIYSLSLAVRYYPDISDDEINAMMFAGLLHDCRRKNDNADSQHGMRAAMWLDENSQILPKKLHLLSPAVCFAMSVHSDSYEDISARSEYGKFGKYVDILKTADALDRYRFPRSDWWLSPEFLRLRPSIKDMSFAFDFMAISENLFLSCKDNQESIAGAWKQLIIKGSPRRA